MRTTARRYAALFGLLLMPWTALLAYDGEIEVTFHYDSESGDFIGQGGSATWTEAEGDWTVSRNSDSGASFSFDEDPGSSFWSLDFAAPDGVELSTGTYLDAQRFPFQDPGRPGLAVFGEGRGCNSLTGQFSVTQVRFDYFGQPVRFSGDFEQHCEGAEPALTGTLDFSRGVLPPIVAAEGNVLVSADNQLWEYTVGGVLVREIPIMESTGTPPPSSEDARDVAMDGAGRIHVFTGSADPVLSSASESSWQQNSFPDWALTNNLSYGRVTAFGDYVFATDMLTGDDGILRFDAAAGYSGERFPGPTGFGLSDYISLTVGLDGRLYALANDENIVDIYFPSTMESVGQVDLVKDVRGLAVDASGTIYGASWDGNIYRFDDAGAVDASLNPDGIGSLHDIDLTRGGQIVVSGGFDDGFAVADTTLSSATAFPIPTNFANPFVAFVQRPSSPLFGSGFEAGGTQGWSRVAGEVAGFLDVNAGAAMTGNFGLEVTVGASCASPQDRIVTSPPTISGVFEGCNSVTASGVQVVDPGATFQAGSRITLDNDFSVGAGVDFEALLDSALLDGFAFLEDDTPSAETSYRARFDLNLDDMDLADTDTFDVLVGYSNGGDAQFRVVIKRNAALMEDRLVLAAREDGGGSVETPPGEETLLPDGWNRLEIHWHAEPGGGQILVSLNGAPFVGVTGLDNDLARVDRVRLGVVAGSVGSSSGNLDIDDFYSWQ